MTAAEELTKLEATYGAWIDAGCPQQMMMNGRQLTTSNMDWIAKRIDQLRAAVARSSNGSFSVGQFRRPE